MKQLKPSLRSIGWAIAGIWLIVLIGALTAPIYREIDEPTLQEYIAESISQQQQIAQLTQREEARRRYWAALDAVPPWHPRPNPWP